MPPFSGHAILCKQGRWGRGALPRTYVSVVTVSSVGGKAEEYSIFFLLLALLRTAAAESHYDVLGVASDAAPDAIRAAFRRIALADHPDKLPPDSAAAVREAAVRRFQRANEASSLRPCAPTRTCHKARHLLGAFLLGL